MAEVMEIPPQQPEIQEEIPEDLPQVGNNVLPPQDYIERNRLIGFRPPRTGLENKDVILNLMRYLSCKDLLNCRELCYNWNIAIIFCCPKAQLGIKGKIRDKWYTEAVGLDVNRTIPWNTLELHHFSYRRNSNLIKEYWRNAACMLKTLTMSRCSFECDGFIFLLDNCPVLETLNLKHCKLRDLDDIHNTVKRPRLELEAEPMPLPVTQPIRHLSIESMSRIECCFMDYLTERRTGQLESINITKCFQPTPATKATTEATARHLARYMEFEGNLRKLIQQNIGTLRKVELHENDQQEEFFGRLADPGRPITTISTMAFTLLPDDNGHYQNLIRFMNNVQGLQNLTLEFKGAIQTTPLRNVLANHETTLQKLKLIIHGDKVGKSEAFHLNFERFPALESLIIEDGKAFLEKQIRSYIGGRRAVRRRRRTVLVPAVDIPGRIRQVQTHLESDFLQTLPQNLRKFTVTKYMATTNFMHALAAHEGSLNSFRLLTKLEIYGPWLYSMAGVIGTIAEQLTNLVTLALTACGIEDSHMTDLNDKAVGEMRTCLTYGLALCTPGATPSSEAVHQAVEGAMRADLELPRRRLSDLPNLRHLDLSKNVHLSDVTMFDALRIPELRTLLLDGCNRITDAGLEFIPLHCELIEELNVKNCRKVSKYGLNRLVTRCKKLKKLFTTKIIQTREIEGFEIQMNPNYTDIVSISTDPQMEGFVEDD